MRVYYAPHIDLLFGELRKNLADSVAERDPFMPEIIITPNQNIASYLKLELAKATGIAINLEFPFPETALQNLYRNLKLYEKTGLKPARGFFSNQTTDTSLIRFATQNDWQSLILHRLLSGSSRFFSKYLGDASGVRERKAWALSRRLAAYFREYRYHRPDFFQNSRSASQSENMKEAQLALLQQAKEDLETLQLTDFFSVAQELPELAKLMPQKQVLRLFATAQFSRFHTNLLLRLSEYIQIELYQIKIDESLVSGNIIGDLLAQWNQASRQGEQLLHSLAAELKISVEQSIIQPDIQTKPPVIQFISATSLRKETEQVAEFILQEISQNTSLSLSDIAVLTPDINRYWPHIQAVFHQADIPIVFNLTDASAATSSAYAKGALALLELTTGLFTRKNLFSLYYNPCFLAKFSLTRRETSRWFRWTEELDARSGSTWKDFYSCPAEARDWQTALERLRLGLVMSPRPEIDSPYPLPHVPGWLEENSSLYNFCRITEELRSLHENNTFSQNNGTSLITEFINLLDNYLAIPEDRPLEAQARHAIMRACSAEINRLTILPHYNNHFTAPLLKALVQETAESLPLRFGRYLGGGVSVSSLLPMRPVPFKIIFIMGMDDDLFPRQTRGDSLDLRLTDLAPKTEQDQLSDIDSRKADLQLLSEIISACERSLYLSHLSLDARKDINLLPARPYRELQHLLSFESISINYAEILSQPQNRLINSEFRSFEKQNTQATKKYNEDISITGKEIIQFLQFPLEHWLNRNNLKKRNTDDESDRRSEVFEDTAFRKYQKNQILINAIYDCFSRKIFPDDRDFSSEIMQIVTREINIQKKSFRTPYGLFFKSERDNLKKSAELTAACLQSLTDVQWKEFQRVACGETAFDEYLIDRRPAWKITTELGSASISCVSNLYRKTGPNNYFEIISFESSGFTPARSKNLESQTKLIQQINLLGVWLPLLPLLSGQNQPIELKIINIPAESDIKKTKKKANAVFKYKTDLIKFHPELARKYLARMIDLILVPSVPDAFNVKLLDSGRPELHREAVLQYRHKLEEAWRNKDQDFNSSLKYRNPLTDILPLWFQSDLENMLAERYLPLYNIAMPEIGTDETATDTKAAKTRKKNKNG